MWIRLGAIGFFVLAIVAMLVYLFWFLAIVFALIALIVGLVVAYRRNRPLQRSLDSHQHVERLAPVIERPVSTRHIELVREAAEIVAINRFGSPHLLQRKMHIPLEQAARLIDDLARVGIVGDGARGNVRPVLLSSDQVAQLNRESVEGAKRNPASSAS